MKTLEYSIVIDESADEVVNLVNEALREGWQLQGGLSVTVAANTQGTFFLFGQAMVKETTAHPVAYQSERKEPEEGWPV